MARVGLGLGAQELATLAGVSYPTLNRFEKGERVSDASIADIQHALEAKGAAFRLKSGMATVTIPVSTD